MRGTAGDGAALRSEAKAKMRANKLAKENEALNKKVGYFVGKYYNDEKVMIVSMPLYLNDRVSGVIRSITSLEKADKLIARIVRISLLISLIIMGLMITLGNIFSRSIIIPIKEISIYVESIHQTFNVGYFPKSYL